MAKSGKAVGAIKRPPRAPRPWSVRYDYGRGPVTRGFRTETAARRFYVSLANRAEPPLDQSIREAT